jgi:flagellar hook-associated protein 3 FlgL
MRIGTLFFNERISNDILHAQAQMADSQLQLSTGRRIVTPSDDPSGAKAVLDTEKFQATTEQYQENIAVIAPRLELEETVLANANDIMQRVRELAIQGATDVYSSLDKGFIADEIDQLLDQMLGLAGTKDSNDEHLFSGFDRKTAPINDTSIYPPELDQTTGLYRSNFTYEGDQGSRKVPISANRQVLDVENGYEVFFYKDRDLVANTVTQKNVFESIYNLSAALRTDPAAAIQPDMDAVIADIELAMDQLTSVRSQAGARLATIEQQESANADFILNYEMQLSSIRDLDYAEAITRLNRDTTALEAAQSSYVKIQGLSLFNYL